jgi:hypothetical protein
LTDVKAICRVAGRCSGRCFGSFIISKSRRSLTLRSWREIVYRYDNVDTQVVADVDSFAGFSLPHGLVSFGVGIRRPSP